MKELKVVEKVEGQWSLGAFELELDRFQPHS
jgi:hypothetical protein